MKNKKVLAVLTAAAIMCANLSALPMSAIAEDEQIKVYLDGVQIEFDVDPVTENDRTLVPMRPIFEALGAEIAWDDDTQTALATRGDDIIIVTVDQNGIIKSGEIVELDVPARMVDDRVLVPVRAIAESLGADVEWDEETQTVIITSAENSEQEHARTDGMIAFGEMSDEGMQKLQESTDEIRSDFEQTYLPTAIYQAAENGYLYDFMADATIVEYVTDAWYNCVMQKIFEIENELNSLYYIPTDMTEDNMFDAYYDLIEEAGIEIPIRGMAVNDNDTLGMRMGVIAFYEAESGSQCKYIGFIASADGGVRYFTAENNPDDAANWYVYEQYEDGQNEETELIEKSGDDDADLNVFGQLIIDVCTADAEETE